MGTIEVWLGPAGSGKTRAALGLLSEELARNRPDVRFLVPTVAQKRRLEELLLTCNVGAGLVPAQPGGRGQAPPLHGDCRNGLLGDPMTTFFNFAEEVARRAQVNGRRVSALQKVRLLREVVDATPAPTFAAVAQYDGFITALGEAVDELKVAMVLPAALTRAGKRARAEGKTDLADRLRDLAALYDAFQTRLQGEELFDEEGLMWVAAAALRKDPGLFDELSCLILDGFARLTPIQIDFLQALAPRVKRVVVVFDYEAGRGELYRPVEDSLAALRTWGCCNEVWFQRPFEVGDNDLEALQRGLFCEEKWGQVPFSRGANEESDNKDAPTSRTIDAKMVPVPIFPAPDCSVRLLTGATPAHEAELVARAVRRILQGGCPALRGRPVTTSDIVLLARNADALRGRYARAFQHYGLTLEGDPPALAHTALGRSALAAVRVAREGWTRENVGLLLTSGFLEAEEGLAHEVDLRARLFGMHAAGGTPAVPDGSAACAESLAAALAPVATFIDAWRGAATGEAALEAVGALLTAFKEHAAPRSVALPDVDAEGARRRVAMEASFTAFDALLADLRGLGALGEALTRDEMGKLLEKTIAETAVPTPAGGGIRLLPAHTTGGEKFAVVALVGLQEGVFPRQQHSSPFLLDEDRKTELSDLEGELMPRRRLEEDEPFYFLHAVSAAERCLILSYAENDGAGARQERSPFLDEVEAVLPRVAAARRTPALREQLPTLRDAGSERDALAALVHGLHSARDAATQNALAATLAEGPWRGAVAALFRLGNLPEAGVVAVGRTLLSDQKGEDRTLLSDHKETVGQECPTYRTRPFSASELQRYTDCPFLWFIDYGLGLREIRGEYGPLDTGNILHAVLKQLFLNHRTGDDTSVHLETVAVEALIAEACALLDALLEKNALFKERPLNEQEHDRATLRDALADFVAAEYNRAATRGLHPLHFERGFITPGEGPDAIPLRGYLDRVDVADDDPTRAVVVDYKSNSVPGGKDIQEGWVLQAPVYLAALEEALGLHALGVEFLGITSGNDTGVYHPDAGTYNAGPPKQRLSAEGWESFRERARGAMEKAAAGIRAGDIGLRPTTSRCPKDCAYQDICRGDEFTLMRRIETAKKGAVEDGDQTRT